MKLLKMLVYPHKPIEVFRFRPKVIYFSFQDLLLFFRVQNFFERLVDIFDFI